MSEPQVTWTGETPDELAAKLRAHPFAAVREPLMQQITLVALGRAQRLTPVRTGTLRRSETNRVEDGGLRGYIGSNVVYAPFVHARVPFFADAIDDSQADIQQLLQAAGDAYLKDLT
jgi:hypothetical protein